MTIPQPVEGDIVSYINPDDMITYTVRVFHLFDDEHGRGFIGHELDNDDPEVGKWGYHASITAINGVVLP